MDKHEFVEELSMKDILDGFISSYAERDMNEEFVRWLEDKLRQEVPDMPNAASEKMAAEIIKAVEDYDETLDELNVAIDAGQSKEEWLVERLSDTYADVPFDAVGKRLQQIENDFAVSNMKLMQEINKAEGNAISVIDADPVEWNEYSVKNKVYEIGNQVILNGVAVAANVLKEKVQDDAVDISGIVKETFQDGLIKDSEEVKVVVAGAIKVAAEKGLENILPKDTPMDVIGGLAGAAVEGAEALFDVANGESTMLDAMDKIGRANVAAGCRYLSGALKERLSEVPIFGPMLVDLAGGLLKHMDGPKFAENVYIVVRDAAVAMWEGVKESHTAKVLIEAKNRVFG